MYQNSVRKCERYCTFTSCLINGGWRLLIFRCFFSEPQRKPIRAPCLFIYPVFILQIKVIFDYKKECFYKQESTCFFNYNWSYSWFVSLDCNVQLNLPLQHFFFESNHAFLSRALNAMNLLDICLVQCVSKLASLVALCKFSLHWMILDHIFLLALDKETTLKKTFRK